MRIGVPKEVKNLETRVGITPAGVRNLVERGHSVLVETGAGVLSAFTDEEYRMAGAKLVSVTDAWGQAEMVVKVKEPTPTEYGYFRPGLVLFTYLHLAPLPELTEKLLEAKVTSIAYETLQDAAGTLPLLVPMSEVAGRIAVQIGATYLQKENGGRGLLLGGVPGVLPAEVCILGGGIVGTNSAKIAVGMGANVTIVDKSLNRLRELDDIFGGRVRTVASNSWNIAAASAKSDLLIGGVLIPGASAPKLLTAGMVKGMKPGAVIVDVAIDQGGCVETARPTTHSDPSYVVAGVVHYCVTNMPAAVPNTSTLALTNATFPYVMEIAERGVVDALKSSTGFMKGLNTFAGQLTCQPVAASQGKPWTESAAALV